MSIRTCARCQNPIGHGHFCSFMDLVWHPQCFRCFACQEYMSEHNVYELYLHEDQAYHRSCFKELYHQRCDICNDFLPVNSNGCIEFGSLPIWMQKYCPSHEHDGTPFCCSCERMEAVGTKYVMLDDGRKVCSDCLSSAIMDTPGSQRLYMDILEFYESLNLRIEQKIPLLLVEKQAMNEAIGAENISPHLPETRGACLSKERIVSTISKRPLMGPGNTTSGMVREPYKLSRRCEVTAILILYGLPRLLTGAILAHEMMHAYLRLHGYRDVNPEVEEGICQVMSHLWIDDIFMPGSSYAASSSSSAPSQFDKELRSFIKQQIETDPSEEYGESFRAGYAAFQRYGLTRTLRHIKKTGSFP